MDAPTQAISSLRQRMVEDMRMRKLAHHTQKGYGENPGLRPLARVGASFHLDAGFLDKLRVLGGFGAHEGSELLRCATDRFHA